MAFGALPLDQQWALHDYYRFTEDITNAAALQHRALITRLEPTLPLRAGKLVTKLDRVAAELAVVRVRQPAVGKRRTTETRTLVLAVAKPGFDMDRWANIVVAQVAHHLRNGTSPTLPSIPHDDTTPK